MTGFDVWGIFIVPMKDMNINQQLDKISQKNFGSSCVKGRYELTILQVKKALKEAYLLGEKNGYKHGFTDASAVCDCSIEASVNDLLVDTFTGLPVDKTKN